MKMLLTKGWWAAGVLLASQSAFASVPWNGTANYLAAPGAQLDEALVGPFDTFDFGAGIGLIKPDSTVAVGNTFTGRFQTVVSGHILNSVGINTPQLNVSGSGSGFELTAVAQFTGTYTGLSSNSFNFSINGGTASLYFDSNPNHSFAADNGFYDGASILTGTITSGVGSILFPAVVGVGVEQVSLDISGAFGSFDSNVFSPAINGGEALFSLLVKTPFNNTPVIDAVANGANSVGGVSAVGGQLFQLDGTMQLTAVPLPPSAWMFLSSLLGFLSVNRRKSPVFRQAWP